MFHTGMSFAPGGEFDALGDGVHRFAQAKIAPRASETGAGTSEILQTPIGRELFEESG